MIKLLKGCVRASLLLIITLPTAAAEESNPQVWSARVWQSDEGLPDNNVTGVVQTPDGFLWVSTHSSVTRFDGVTFERVPIPTPPGRSQLIRAFLASRGESWVAMEGGIVASVSERATNLLTSANGLSTFRPLSILMDSSRAIWIGYADGSVCRIRSGGVERFTARDGLSGTGVCTVTSDLKGGIWYAKGGRVGMFAEGRFTNLFVFPDRTIRVTTARQGGVWVCAGSQVFHCDEKMRAPHFVAKVPGGEIQPRVLFEDRSGGVWLGTSGSGLFRVDGTNVLRVSTSHPEIEAIAEDQEMNIWVGTTGGGLNRLRPRVIELQGPEQGVPSGSVKSVSLDASGKLWMVTPNSGLACNNGPRWRTLNAKDGWPDVSATCVAGDPGGGVWVGTLRTGLRKYKDGECSAFTRANGLAGDTVRSLMLSRSGDLWVGLEADYCLQRFRGGEWKTFEQPAASRTVRAMAEDKDGRIWLGTSDGYLLRVSGETLVDETYRALRKPIRALHASDDGSIWIGYASAGLGRLHGKHFSVLNKTNGLRGDYICSIVPDSNGGLWFSSDTGIFQVRQRQLEAATSSAARLLSIAMGRDEGFPSLQGSYGYSPNGCRTPDGRVLFAMRTGLAVLHPQRMQPNRIPPPVQVRRVLIDGRLANARSGRGVIVPAGYRKVEIQFTALSFIAPESLQFRYWLRGWDEGWVESGRERTVSFSRLPPGEYDFEVTACNSAGVWNPQSAGMRLNIRPFLWQTWPVRTLVLAVALSAVGLAIRNYERRRSRTQLAQLERQRDLERERTRIARDIHDELGAGLAQIGLLADLGSTQDPNNGGRVQFEKIADRARSAVNSLQEIVWAANPKNDNLARLADFLCQAADACFESSPVRCRKDVPATLPQIPIAAETRHNLALAVKEALTNALKHAEAKMVLLKLVWQEPELTVEVEDDGKGFAPVIASPRGNGLDNQLSRMREIGGTVRVESTPGQGTKVLFQLKLSEPSYHHDPTDSNRDRRG